MSQPGKWYQYFIRYEWILFYVLVFLNALPAVQQDFFPSVDGPTHLYNAKVILGLVSGDSEFLSQYYSFNTWIVPNWGGHFILAILLSMFSGAVASKVFIGLCLILLPASFRYCVKKINPEAAFTTYLVLPFTYTFMLCMGLYNFYVGIILLFTTLGVLIEYRRSVFSLRVFVILFLLILLCYLSHFFVFISVGMTAVFLWLPDLSRVVFKKESINTILKKLIFLFITFIIPLLLVLSFFAHTARGYNKIYLFKSELLQWITSCRSIICYKPEDESLYSTYVFLVLMVLFSIALYLRIKQLQEDLGEGPVTIRSLLLAFRFQDAFLIILMAFLFLYFRVPDSDSLAGFVSIRLNLMVFLFLILWSSGFDYPRFISVTAFAVLLFSQYSLLTIHNYSFETLNRKTPELKVIESCIKENTVVLPLDYSGDWLTPHNSNYLGIDKALIILENHECNNSYFPLKWKNDSVMKDITASNGSRLNHYFRNASPGIIKEVDYIFVQDKVSLPADILSEILKEFSLKKETKHLLLFENKTR